MGTGQQFRSNKIDTPKEYTAEVVESLDDILKVTKDYCLSLSPEVTVKVIDALPEKVFVKILHEVSKYAAEDLQKFTEKLNQLVKSSEDTKEIVRGLALTGEVPKKYLTEDLKKLLYKEVFSNDPQDIQMLNKVELGLAIQDLRYTTQRLIVKHLPQDIHSKYDLTFYDLTITNDEKKLLEEQKRVQTTLSKFDDYVVEYKLGLVRDYEPEEQIYLGKKVLSLAKLEKRIVPEEISSHLKDLVEKYKENFNHLKMDVSLDSEDPYSFHQVNLLGSNYNFGYFGTSKAEFHGLPKLDNRPVLLLLHGLSQDWACWRWMIGELRDRYQILVPDMNGFGDSSELVLFHSLSNFTSYIANFLKNLKVTEYDVMGHSAGGFTTQQLLESPMLQPKHAVMLSSAPHLAISFINYALAKFLKATSLQNLYFRTLYKATSIVGIKLGYPLVIYTPEEKLRRIYKTSPRTLAELLECLITEYNIEGRKIKLSTKCMIVYGTKDLLITPESTRSLTKIFKDAVIIEIPNVGHAEVLRSLPTTFKKELLSFLKT